MLVESLDESIKKITTPHSATTQLSPSSSPRFFIPSSPGRQYTPIYINFTFKHISGTRLFYFELRCLVLRQHTLVMVKTRPINSGYRCYD